MLDDFLTDGLPGVGELVRGVAAAEIMPRWRHLAPDEIEQKAHPHDLVTTADRCAEKALTTSLATLLPGSLVVGEESVHADPAVYQALQESAPVWIVDPLDGTRQFVRGEPGFCVLVALARDGEVLASWTYAPVPQEMAVAVRGRGAWLNGARLRSGSPAAGPDLRIAADSTTPAEEDAFRCLNRPGIHTRPAPSAGLAYLDIARRELDALAFSWENAWDHAAGLLLVTEAGGAHTTLTGEPFRIRGGNTLPFTAARDAGTAEHVRRLLTGEDV